MKAGAVHIEDLPPEVRDKVLGIEREFTADQPVDDKLAVLGKVFVLVSGLTQGEARWVCREILRHLAGRIETRGGYRPRKSEEEQR